MTYDDDMLQFDLDGRTVRLPLKQVGLDWPPPENVEIHGVKLKRVQLSRITDEQRSTMSNVIRGALYEVVVIKETLH